MVIRVVAGGNVRILVSNSDTKGIADGKIIFDPPYYKVSGTKKLNGRTMYIVEPSRQPNSQRYPRSPRSESPCPPKNAADIVATVTATYLSAGRHLTT
ncbi:unnamed protein product [Gemmata massiliana]|uniref:Uncharacterized protein n=1 Tax=Gemmata massiliana TaxID=1210884 RepID=A0A6P2D0H3_9BACT|nr:unnamed protein product [Gemmata massiliana]